MKSVWPEALGHSLLKWSGGSLQDEIFFYEGKAFKKNMAHAESIFCTIMKDGAIFNSIMGVTWMSKNWAAMTRYIFIGLKLNQYCHYLVLRRLMQPFEVPTHPAAFPIQGRAIDGGSLYLYISFTADSFPDFFPCLFISIFCCGVQKWIILSHGACVCMRVYACAVNDSTLILFQYRPIFNMVLRADYVELESPIETRPRRRQAIPQSPTWLFFFLHSALSSINNRIYIQIATIVFLLSFPLNAL